MKQILVVPQNLVNDTQLGKIVVDMIGYIPSDIIQTEEYNLVRHENIHGYLHLKDSLKDIDLDFLDQYMNGLEEPEEYKTSAIFPIPAYGAFILLAVNTIDRCKENFNESSNYELNNAMKDILIELELSPVTNNFGLLKDIKHNKYYYGEKIFPLLINTTGGMEINLDNNKLFKENYEEFIEKFSEVIAGNIVDM